MEKAKKHGDKRTENFSLRLQKVQVLVQEVEQELPQFGLDVMSLRKAVLSYEKKKVSGKKSGLRSLGKGTVTSVRSFSQPRGRGHEGSGDRPEGRQSCWRGPA
jgi:hypothetical protein